MLNSLDDPDLTGHADWQALLDFAATRLDPDAEALGNTTEDER